VLVEPGTPSVVDETNFAAAPLPVAPLASKAYVGWLGFLTMVVGGC